MLVLSRRPKEAIVIGDGPSKIVVEVVRVAGDRVTVGVTAPKDVNIVRGELKGRDDGRASG